jgi:hypothetical protein
MTSSNAAYVGFTRALAKMFDDADIKYQRDPHTETGIIENAKWVDFQFRLDDGTMHKLYVPKNKGLIGRIHTTIAFDTRVEGVLELPSTTRRPEYRNGLIRSHLSGADPERVANLIITALRRGAPVPQKRPAVPRTQHVASAETTRGPQSSPEGAPGNWTLTKDGIAEVDTEISEAIEQHHHQ